MAIGVLTVYTACDWSAASTTSYSPTISSLFACNLNLYYFVMLFFKVNVIIIICYLHPHTAPISCPLLYALALTSSSTAL